MSELFCPDTGKVRYRDRGAAERARRAIGKKGPIGEPAACRHCGGWHLLHRSLHPARRRRPEKT